MTWEANKEKWLEWGQNNKDMSFDDLIYTDETTVNIERHDEHAATKKDRNQDTSQGKRPCKGLCLSRDQLLSPHKSVHLWGEDDRVSLYLYFVQINSTFNQGCESRLAPLCLGQQCKALLQFGQNVYVIRGVNWWSTPPIVSRSQPCSRHNIQNTTYQCFLQSLQLRFHLHRGHLLATAGVR